MAAYFKVIFLYDYNKNSEASWCSHIRQIFFKNGMENIYNMLLLCDLNVAKFTLLTKYTESGNQIYLINQNCVFTQSLNQSPFLRII